MIRSTIALMALLATAPVQATEAAWALLRDGGHAVLLAHAYSTGTVDPANFDIEKCSTQGNLSERGKQQARKIGALFATRAAATDRVLTSRYCRCLDTARIAFGSGAETLDALDPLPADPAGADVQKAAILEEIRTFSGSGNLVLVTHPANIAALTGVTPREGEAVIVRIDAENLRVIGRIIFN